MKDKKGLSEIISSVMLILVVIVAIGLIVAFVVPMIKDNLSGSKSCFDLNDYFKISGTSCYNTANTDLIVERGMQELEVKGFAVSIQDSSGESKSYRVSPGLIEGVMLYNKTTSAYDIATIVLPNPGESKKYQFDYPGNKISIAPLQKNDKICTASEFTIEVCPEA
ncbi:MAG: hypothetical protein NT076_01165 [Candidatus Pacearchaeota archaeon]|nr:hypothetical protein [Candidatus Pacearchaeota archaeon]